MACVHNPMVSNARMKAYTRGIALRPMGISSGAVLDRTPVHDLYVKAWKPALARTTSISAASMSPWSVLNLGIRRLHLGTDRHRRAPGNQYKAVEPVLHFFGSLVTYVGASLIMGACERVYAAGVASRFGPDGATNGHR
jgi:hypothetical protein